MVCRILILVLLLHGYTAGAQIRLFHFIDSIYEEKNLAQNFRLKAELENSGYKPSDDDAVNDTVMRLLYMHMLLTTNFAVNGDTYGAFKIPFFWNYTDPNPRDSIYHRKRGKPLSQLPPPFDQPDYRSLASTDRIPTLFWGDFAVESPKYSWDYLPGFYTFGWCSEREMAFKAWLGAQHINTTICFKDAHVWNEVQLASMPGYIIYIDNSFHIFQVKPISKKTPPNPNDKFLTWYNQNGANTITRQKLSNLCISQRRAAELEQQIISFFTANTDDR